MVEGLGAREGKGMQNQCWYDVEDMVEGEETVSKKDPFGAVEEEGNGVGWG